jgi:hypothetical protein
MYSAALAIKIALLRKIDFHGHQKNLHAIIIVANMRQVVSFIMGKLIDSTFSML